MVASFDSTVRVHFLSCVCAHAFVICLYTIIFLCLTYMCFYVVHFVKTVIPLGIVGATAGVSKLDAYDVNHM